MTCDFTSFSTVFVISGQWLGANERLCEMEPGLWLERLLPPGGLKPWMARAVGLRLTY